MSDFVHAAVSCAARLLAPGLHDERAKDARELVEGDRQVAERDNLDLNAVGLVLRGSAVPETDLVLVVVRGG